MDWIRLLNGNIQDWNSFREKNPHEALDLSGLSIKSMTLDDIDLSKAILFETKFIHCDMRNANFDQAQGIETTRFQGCVLSGSTFPKDFFSSILDHLAEASKSARIAGTLLLSLCVYVLLVLSIKDGDMVTGAGNVSIALLKIDIPSRVYAWLFPLFVLLLYFFQFLHFQIVWQDLTKLPAVFPDGRSLDEVAYPWLANWLFVSFLPKSRKPEKPGFYNYSFSVAMIWGIAPISLLYFWFWYLKRQDIMTTSFHILFFVISIILGGIYWVQCKRGLIDSEYSTHLTKWLPMGGTFLCASFTFIFFCGPKIPVSLLYNDISDQDLSKRNTHFAKNSVGLDLSNRRLRFLTAKDVVFGGATLSGSNLQGAILDGSDLSNANLKSTDLRAASLNDSNLSEANLVGADLRESSMSNVILKGAILDDADLRHCGSFSFTELMGPKSMKGVILRDTKLDGWRLEDTERIVNEETKPRGLVLNGADLSGASATSLYLRWSSLSNAYFDKAVLNSRSVVFDHAILTGASFRGAQLDGASMVGVDLTDAIFSPESSLTSTDLSCAILRRAHLDGADLSRAYLQGATLTGATLVGANLSGADLRGVRGMKAAMLASAMINEDTLLPENLGGPAFPSPCGAP